METLSTTNHAERIARSLNTGQMRTAINQAIYALSDHCEPYPLLIEVARLAGDDKALLIAAKLIKGE